MYMKKTLKVCTVLLSAVMLLMMTLACMGIFTVKADAAGIGQLYWSSDRTLQYKEELAGSVLVLSSESTSEPITIDLANKGIYRHEAQGSAGEYSAARYSPLISVTKGKVIIKNGTIAGFNTVTYNESKEHLYSEDSEGYIAPEATPQDEGNYVYAPLIYIAPGAEVELVNVTVEDSWNKTPGMSGVTNLGGGIANFGTLTMSGSTVQNCYADYYGGGIYNAGTLNLGNSSRITMCGTGTRGGGVYNADTGTLNMSDSEISYCTAMDAKELLKLDEAYYHNMGGGIYTAGRMSLGAGTHVVYNTAWDVGGGIYIATEAKSAKILGDADSYVKITNNKAGVSARYHYKGAGIHNHAANAQLQLDYCNIDENEFLGRDKDGNKFTANLGIGLYSCGEVAAGLRGQVTMCNNISAGKAGEFNTYVYGGGAAISSAEGSNESVFDNVLISGNIAYAASGIYVEERNGAYTTLLITSNTRVIDNYRNSGGYDSHTGGIIVNHKSTLKLDGFPEINGGGIVGATTSGIPGIVVAYDGWGNIVNGDPTWEELMSEVGRIEVLSPLVKGDKPAIIVYGAPDIDKNFGDTSPIYEGPIVYGLEYIPENYTDYFYLNNYATRLWRIEEDNALSKYYEVTITYKPGSSEATPYESYTQIGIDGKPTALSPSQFTRAHYTQTGWVDADGNEYELGGSYTFTKDIELTAVWAKTEYTMYFFSNLNGVSTVTQKHAWGDSFNLPVLQAPSADYTFLGWARSKLATTPDYTYNPNTGYGGFGEPFVFNYEKNQEMYAVWRTNKVTFVFENVKDLTFYADYDMSEKLNDGEASGSTNKDTVYITMNLSDVEGGYELPYIYGDESPAAEGYNVKWLWSYRTFDEVEANDGDLILEGLLENGSVVYVTPQFTPRTYTLTYNLIWDTQKIQIVNGKPQTVTTTNTKTYTQEVTYGEYFDVIYMEDMQDYPTVQYLKRWWADRYEYGENVGYWYLTPGKNTRYKWAENMTFESELYYYSVYLNVDLSDLSGASADPVKKYFEMKSTGASLSSMSATLQGYTLSGWLVPEFSDAQYNANDTLSRTELISFMKNKGVTSYTFDIIPVFEANTNTPFFADVYFENENGEYVYGDHRAYFYDGTTDALTTGVEEYAEGYLSSEPTGEWLSKYSLHHVENVTVTGDGQAVAKIFYSRNTKLVTFDADGGKIGEGTSLTLIGAWGSAIDTDTYWPKSPTREGYGFGGWYTQRNGAGTRVEAAGFRVPESDTTYYAYWAPRSIVEIRLPDAYAQQQSYYTTQARPVFDITVVWSDGVEETISSDNASVTWSGFGTSTATTAAKTATLTYSGVSASFTYTVSDLKVNISFNLNGGTGGSPIMAGYSAGMTATIPETSLTRTGYSHVGWLSSHDGKTYKSGDSFTVPTEDITLTAVWKLKAPAINGISVDGESLDFGTSFIASKTLTYDGGMHTISLSIAHELDLPLTYKWYYSTSADVPLPPWITDESEYSEFEFAGDTSSITISDVSDSGTYYCLISTTYNGEASAVSRACVAVTVVKGEASIEASRSEFTYTDGLRIDLSDYITVSGGAAWSATVEKNGVEFSYSNKVISDITKAGGTFTVTVTTEEADNYVATTKSFTITLNKGEQSISIAHPTDTYYVFEQYALALSGAKGEVSFGCSDKGQGVALSVLPDGKLTFTSRGVDGRAVIVATSAATDLYNKAETSVTVYAQKVAATAPSTPPAGLNICVGRTLSAVTLPEGYTWKSGATIMSTLGKNSVKAIYTPTDTTNYTPIEVDLDVEVNAHTGGNASCQQRAICTSCHQAYGDLGACSFSETYLVANSDADKHYHVCTLCGKKDAGEAHTPNVLEATEETAKYCTVCNYIIASQLNHTHKYGENVAESFRKSPATCTQPAVYYKSCACGNIDYDSTFESGSPDENAHLSTPSTLESLNDGTHNIRYTCCNKIYTSGVSCISVNMYDDCEKEEYCVCGYITKREAQHSFEGEYLKDGDGHWHKCESCSVTDAKKAHTSSADDGDCTTAVLCGECAYETVKGNKNHAWSDTYMLSNSDADRHYLTCTVNGCNARDAGAAHTPNIPSATEESAKFCTACNYMIQAQLGHTHKYGNYAKPECIKAEANCTSPAIYYSSCECGDIDYTSTFESGSSNPLAHTSGTTSVVSRDNGTHDFVYNCCNNPKAEGITCTSQTAVNICTKEEYCICGYITKAAREHDFGDNYSFDANNHWHKCNACDAIDTRTAHTPNVPAATEETSKFCTACKYVIQAQLGHAHKYGSFAKAEYVKAEATCTSVAIYYKSCECGDIDYTSTFEGSETNPAAHTSSTTSVVSRNNGTHDIVYTCCNNPKTEGIACVSENVVNICTQEERCACGYITKAAREHDFSDNYSYDASNHWHKCNVCDATDTKTAHTPNIPEATEESAKFCTECNYEIQTQIGHEHRYEERVEEAYAATPATCESMATYYLSCACGHKSGDTFEAGELAEHKGGEASCASKAVCSVCEKAYGELLPHNYTVEEHDATHHWNRCSACTAIDARVEHAYGDDNACDGCEYEKQTTSEPTEPKPTEPKPTEPKPTEPKPTEAPTDESTEPTDTPSDVTDDTSDGLPPAAIVAIVVGAIAVLGGGGFALYWFVIRKRKMI